MPSPKSRSRTKPNAPAPLKPSKAIRAFLRQHPLSGPKEINEGLKARGVNFRTKKIRIKRPLRMAKRASNNRTFIGTMSPHSVSGDESKRKNVPKSRKARVSRQDNSSRFVKNLVFVGMSFRGDGMEDAFLAIKETCKSLKMQARRVDDFTTSGFIILEIIDLIEKAEFIIFDLTYERPNVYYELGYTHGVGNSPTNVLLLAKDGTELHFDIAALRVQFYKSTEHLRRIVKSNLSGMMKATRD